MFTPTRADGRDLLFETWRLYQAAQPLVGLQQLALEVLLLHPEYHAALSDPDTFRDRDYRPEHGETNPFLHMFLHVSLREQISIDQPPGVLRRYQRALAVTGDAHEAEHQMIDCLVEMVWQAQRHGTAMDPAIYFGCLDGKFPPLE